jgi:hypothetical protein
MIGGLESCVYIGFHQQLEVRHGLWPRASVRAVSRRNKVRLAISGCIGCFRSVTPGPA